MAGDIGTALTSSGVAPSGAQTSLSQYTMGQGDIANADKFSHGMGHSTNVTQADSGPAAGFALSQGQQSLADTAAMSKFLNSQFQNLAGGLGGILGKAGGGGR